MPQDYDTNQQNEYPKVLVQGHTTPPPLPAEHAATPAGEPPPLPTAHKPGLKDRLAPALSGPVIAGNQAGSASETMVKRARLMIFGGLVAVP